jgi:hypothetical protein
MSIRNKKNSSNLRGTTGRDNTLYMGLHQELEENNRQIAELDVEKKRMIAEIDSRKKEYDEIYSLVNKLISDQTSEKQKYSQMLAESIKNNEEKNVLLKRIEEARKKKQILEENVMEEKKKFEMLLKEKQDKFHRLDENYHNFELKLKNCEETFGKLTREKELAEEESKRKAEEKEKEKLEMQKQEEERDRVAKEKLERQKQEEERDRVAKEKERKARIAREKKQQEEEEARLAEEEYIRTSCNFLDDEHFIDSLKKNLKMASKISLASLDDTYVNSINSLKEQKLHLLCGKIYENFERTYRAYYEGLRSTVEEESRKEAYRNRAKETTGEERNCTFLDKTDFIDKNKSNLTLAAKISVELLDDTYYEAIRGFEKRKLKELCGKKFETFEKEYIEYYTALKNKLLSAHKARQSQKPSASQGENPFLNPRGPTSDYYRSQGPTYGGPPFSSGTSFYDESNYRSQGPTYGEPPFSSGTSFYDQSNYRSEAFRRGFTSRKYSSQGPNPPRQNPPQDSTSRQNPRQSSNPPRQNPRQSSNPPRQNPPQSSNPPRENPRQSSNPPRGNPRQSSTKETRPNANDEPVDDADDGVCLLNRKQINELLQKLYHAINDRKTKEENEASLKKVYKKLALVLHPDKPTGCDKEYKKYRRDAWDVFTQYNDALLKYIEFPSQSNYVKPQPPKAPQKKKDIIENT